MHHADMPPIGDATWQLVYTKPRAERWVELNLRRQHYLTLLPLVRARAGFQPLFPRYVFVGIAPDSSGRPIAGTRGVQYIVHFGTQPARVPLDVVRDVSARMDARGVVALEKADPEDPLFAKRARERTRALLMFAQAGFRIKSA
jgi:transcription antitermination factor NusG